MISSFKIGRFEISETSPTFVIAELSGNHAGQLEKAIELVRVSKKAGVNAIKLQTYTADTITLNSNEADFQIPSNNPWESNKNLYSLYKKAHTPWEWHDKIFAEARRLGLEAFSSPFDETSVDFLEGLEVPAYKIASPEITHIPLIRKIAKTGKPIILSTGTSNLFDIDLAVRTIRSQGNDQIAILKCNSTYPSPPEHIHLKTIPHMKETFRCFTGLSDHSVGLGVAIGAVALGAKIVEKHITCNEKSDSVDGFFSMDQQEFKNLVDEIRRVEKAVGRVQYDLDKEGRKAAWGRRSLYVSKEIQKGETLTSDNIKCVRPSFGLHPKYYDLVLGSVANVDLKPGQRLSWEMFDSVDP